MNFPIWLTASRILLIPLFVLVFYLPWSGAGILAASIFVVAAITDWLDGYLARRWNQTSAFGAFLDPVADKLIVAVALILVLQRDARVLIALPVVIIISREITVSALREWMAEIGQRTKVAVSWIGKLKTSVQMGALVVLIGFEPGHVLYTVGMVGLYAAALLTLWSMMAYLRAAWPSLSAHS
ncbi:CDP-diacylglycerol--glycerol-3-phosphate 3-phosphatidyltransferase [Candidatus Macondimonas diazotrophica]|uniref:CDP-diacylglycerol--glycerol-3-phosphate 3-phosphatidyltransferase n=1 Tax=Candidatus Macondimonas diazotrophica TaxID=2305248 RepID=A0A4Z0FB12_9GAMM|nr:CDP-diacylglycerol--glycerol-3-phosphate 3-phosphatidyltransferase [Candidatus Macondimonas diazotrophica]TFZ82962.1 CDP-diacylglycerol--glycerol-3-phosphate 3-phosphatidyltransferase [Candidatus Macondimonas diazotrophica]HBG32109.1 CDP-diacylglycerol--glycerol-3-phosphate 3-phosphatidyltransferase [Gammaproteobacteria bacterium]HBG50867.1 CDP-diacylglycerol--glycerol-3-phosphate 3-phosphatidyltransferase [Gammaproteobacteria bacterium]